MKTTPSANVVTLVDLQWMVDRERRRQAAIEERGRQDGRVWDWILGRWIERPRTCVR